MRSQDEPRVHLVDGAHPIDELLTKYRPYLRLLAARQLDAKLATRLSASDLVQQTQLEAFRDHGLFHGQTEEQFVAWLKAILRNNVATATQTHLLALKRSVKRETSPQPTPNDRLQEPAGNDESPSAAAMRGEAAISLAQAMERLTEEQYEAIRLRYIEGLSLDGITQRMGRSQTAVAGLLKRGLRGLRDGLLREHE